MDPRNKEGSLVMGDAVFVAITVLFFLAAAACVSGCERIR